MSALGAFNALQRGAQSDNPSHSRNQSQQMDWRGYLERANQPRIEDVSDLITMARANQRAGMDFDQRERLDSLYDQRGDAELAAQAMGVEDRAGGDQGLLNTLGDALSAPLSAVASGARELEHSLRADTRDASLEGFLENFGERELASDFWGFDVDEDDPWYTRGLQHAGNFGLDVAADPLTYVSLGGSVLGRQAATQAVRSHTAGLAAREAGEDALQRWSRRGLDSETAETVLQRASGLSEDGARRVQSQVAARDGSENLADAAAEAFNHRGARGLREFLQEEGLEHLWRQLPNDLQGGVRIRVPFMLTRLAGGDTPVSMRLGGTGGGRVADATGLGQALDLSHSARNRLRASRAGQTMSAAIGGARGDEYAATMSRIIKDGPQGGNIWAQYQTVRDADRLAANVRRGIDQLGVNTAHQNHLWVQQAPDPKVAQQSYTDWIDRPGDLNNARKLDGVYQDESGRYHIGQNAPGFGDMTESELMGVTAALNFQDALNEMGQRARLAGLDLGEIRDYTPRILTEAARDVLGKRRPQAAARRGRGAGGYSPARRREQFRVPELVEDPDDGFLRTEWRDLSLEEINDIARQGGVDSELVQDLFLRDPEVILSQYTDAIGRLAERARFANTIGDSSSVFRAGREATQTAGRRTLVDSVTQRTQPALDRLSQIEELTDGAVRGRDDITRALGEASAAMNAGNMDRAYDQIDAIARGLDDAAERLSRTEWNGLVEADRRTIASAVEEFREGARQIRQAPRDRADTDAAARIVQGDDIGLRPFQGDRVPPELQDAYAPEIIRDAVAKYRQVADDSTLTQNWVDGVYRPWLSMFKQMATVARGPGFHIRNATGGMWNNFLADVTVEDHALSARYAQIASNSGHRAREDAVKDLARRRGIKVKEARDEVSEEAVSNRFEELLRERMSDIEVAPGVSMYDAHRMAHDNGVAWDRGRSLDLSERQVERVRDPSDSVARARRTMYGHLGEDELTMAQRTSDRLLNLGWTRANQRAAQRVESYLRFAPFFQGLKRYGADDGGVAASWLTKATQFDYQDLSQFERQTLRGTLLPFWTWTRNNVPLQFRGLVREPGKMNRLQNAVGEAREAFEDDEFDVVPEWMRDRMGFVTEFQHDGNPIILGPETPAADLNTFFRVNPERPLSGLPDTIQGMGQAFANQLSPAVSVPLELATGQDFFTRQALDDSRTTDIPAYMQPTNRLPAHLVPFVTETVEGEREVDPRLPHVLENAAPWIGQVDRLAPLAGAGAREERAWSEYIRQLAPVVSASTLTPNQEAGALYGEVQQTRDAQQWADPELRAQWQVLTREMGLDPQIAAALMGVEPPRSPQG